MVITRQKKTKGFTLIETVVSMVLLTIFSMGVFLLMQPITDLWRLKTFQQNDAFEARLALMKMSREMEGIRDRQSVSQASATGFSFTDGNNQTVTYSLSSGTLTRNGIALLRNVTSVQYQYIGLSGTGTDTVISTPTVSPSSTDIRRIQLALTVASNGHNLTSRTQIQPRNLY